MGVIRPDFSPIVRRRFLAGWLVPGLVGLTVLAWLPACDVIDQPVPVSEIVSAGRRDTLALDSAETKRGLLTQPATQRVLLEDYTGHQCGNCPGAARKAAELHDQYGDRLVTVATHVGYFARVNATGSYSYDFKTPAGDELNQTFNVDAFGLPQGMIDRTTPTGTNQPVTTIGNWSALVASRLARPAEQRLVVTPLYDGATRTVKVKLHVQYLVAQPGRTFQLVLNVLEDSVHNWQKDYSITDPANPGKDVPDYVHRHVLRAAPLGTFGAVSAASPAAGQEAVTYLTYSLPAAWAERRCHVVAYLLDPATRRIEQVAEAKITAQ